MYKNLSYQDMHKLFYYENGELYNKVSRGNQIKKNTIAGGIHSRKYRTVSVGGKSYFVHRIIFMMHYGCLPPEVDHINQDRLDNRIENLRGVIRDDNLKNKPMYKNNSSGTVGIYARGNKWIALISVNKKLKHLGMFATKQEAIEARKKAEINHGYHPNHGQEAIYKIKRKK